MAITDLHCHLIPGVDDGAQTVDEARTALRYIKESGVATVVATPHLQASRTRRPPELAQRLDELAVNWNVLVNEAASVADGVQLYRGVELALDIPDPDLSDDRLRLGGGTFILVEFPYMTVPPNSPGVFVGLRSQGWTPILAHPERYAGADQNFDIARAWRRAGAYLQLNAGSVLGRYGSDAQRKARILLERGWVDYIASDYHARGRISLSECREFLHEHSGEEQTRLLMETNPARVIEGEAPLPVMPLQTRHGIWSRFARLVRAFR